jgi:hypothetical protein
VEASGVIHKRMCEPGRSEDDRDNSADMTDPEQAQGFWTTDVACKHAREWRARRRAESCGDVILRLANGEGREPTPAKQSPGRLAG